MKKQVSISILILLFGLSIIAQTTKRSYVVMVSLDGFRWDYPDLYATPNLDKLEQEGVKAELIPSFPSKTFPNHYTIATGLVPDHHGIIANKFYHKKLGEMFRLGDRSAVENPAFYGGEPIWVSAETQGVKSAAYFWPGSEAAIKGIQASIWKKYKESTPYSARTDSVISWLEKPYDDRPHLVLLYFDEPDGTGHNYGPSHKKTKRMVEGLDALLGTFISRLDGLDIADSLNLIVLSDHGMGALSKRRHVVLSNHVRDNQIHHQSGSNPIWYIDVKEDQLDKLQKKLDVLEGIKAWRRLDIPAELNFGSNENIPNLVVLADSSWGVSWHRPVAYIGGTHGYEPSNKDMHAIFYAKGPGFKDDFVHPPFNNTNVYALIAHLLQLKGVKIDGDIEMVRELLNQ